MSSLGFIELELGNWKQGQKLFMKSMSIDSTYAQTHFGLSDYYCIIKDYDSAEFHYLKGIEFESDCDKKFEETRDPRFPNLRNPKVIEPLYSLANNEVSYAESRINNIKIGKNKKEAFMELIY